MGDIDLATDFDAIATLSQEGWSHNSHYHAFLLRQLPVHLELALDVGCGTGEFARLLAARAGRVLALDLAPQMITIARERSTAFPNIEYRVANVTKSELPTAAFDCVATIATLHHLPLAETLQQLATAVRPGGTLLLLDLYNAASPLGFAAGAVALPVSALLKLARTGRLRDSDVVRQAWAAHGRHDVYPTLATVRQACATVIPGARVRRHLLYRYSAVWHKPGGGS